VLFAVAQSKNIESLSHLHKTGLLLLSRYREATYRHDSQISCLWLAREFACPHLVNSSRGKLDLADGPIFVANASQSLDSSMRRCFKLVDMIRGLEVSAISQNVEFDIPTGMCGWVCYFWLAVAVSAEDVARLEVAVVIVWPARCWLWRMGGLRMA